MKLEDKKEFNYLLAQASRILMLGGKYRINHWLSKEMQEILKNKGIVVEQFREVRKKFLGDELHIYTYLSYPDNRIPLTPFDTTIEDLQEAYKYTEEQLLQYSINGFNYYGEPISEIYLRQSEIIRQLKLRGVGPRE